MTEERIKLIRYMLERGSDWRAISWNITNGEVSPDALRLQYGRATGKYKETRTRRATSPVDEVEVKNGDISITLHGNGSQESSRVLELTEEELTNPRSILLAHKYDPSAWELKWAKNAIWDGIPKKGEEIRKLYSSRITVQPKTGVDMEDIEGFFAKLNPCVIPAQVDTTTGERILELTLADLHLNKLAWVGTTGESYDLQIACERVRKVVAGIIGRIGRERFSSILIPLGNDLFHSDGTSNKTTAGTEQDIDTRAEKAFSKALDLYVDIVESFRPYGNIEIILVQGNHDSSSSLLFAMTLKAYYRNTPGVTVDAAPMKRKYRKYGNCLIALGHYDADAKRIQTLVPTEAAEMWGQTKHREAHGAHLHSQAVVEYGGFIFRRSPSITGRDQWHYDQGYTSYQTHVTYVWHPENGLEEIWYHGV